MVGWGHLYAWLAVWRNYFSSVCSNCTHMFAKMAGGCSRKSVKNSNESFNKTCAALVILLSYCFALIALKFFIYPLDSNDYPYTSSSTFASSLIKGILAT